MNRTPAHGELTADQLQPGKTYVESTSVGQDLVRLLLKVVVIVAFFALLFTVVFGLFRTSGGDMDPAVKDGDLIMFYRLDKSYVAGDVVATDASGTMQALRVVAVAGDIVDITDKGLLINGALQSDAGLIEDTLPYSQGITFPITVEEGKVFVLGDAREHATDSRIFGTIRTDDTQGQVVGLLRKRTI